MFTPGGASGAMAALLCTPGVKVEFYDKVICSGLGRDKRETP